MTTSQSSIDKLAKALKGYIDTTKQTNQPGNTSGPRNNDLLTSFSNAAKKAATTYENYTDEANAEMVATNAAQLRADYLAPARQLAEAQFDADRSRVRSAVGVDYNNATAIQAAQMKWSQVEQLLEHGQPWDTIIEQAADTHTLAAIVEYAPTWLGTGRTGEQTINMGGNLVTAPGRNMPLDDIDLLAARRAAELGSSKARAYVNSRANHAYNVSVGEDIVKHLEQRRVSDNMDYWADMYAHKAETMAARVTGEPTPNERIEAERKAQIRDQRKEMVEQAMHAPGESPDELAAKIPRGY